MLTFFPLEPFISDYPCQCPAHGEQKMLVCWRSINSRSKDILIHFACVACGREQGDETTVYKAVVPWKVWLEIVKNSSENRDN